MAHFDTSVPRHTVWTTLIYTNKFSVETASNQQQNVCIVGEQITSGKISKWISALEIFKRLATHTFWHPMI